MNPFTFPEINESDIEKEILKLVPKKAGKFRNISTKVLKKSSDACNLALWNFEMLEKQCFSQNLKLADVIPVYKKKDQNLVEALGQSVFFLLFLKFLKDF